MTPAPDLRGRIMQSHLDVVPEVLAEMCTDAHYSGKVEGDWMFGRGATEMKAVGNLFALDALRRIGLQPAATVDMQSVVEEEPTGNGALQTFLEGCTADAVLIPKPEDEKLVRANTGVLWFQVVLRAAAHEAAISAPLKSFTMAGYLDAWVYALYNRIPALCYGVISRNIHGIDECVNLPSVIRITQAMPLFITERCGVKEEYA
ncbi:M20/M25/M40 family metallo-hydrolase [Roseobacter weihaiensis]|uniref:M20/M25/M40 family metallo-hydrolase n=1 Tax=Roseobacter weihaiensis TaxID=2763262 RepID=UPI001D0A8B01|nr:M20/M25/M40 family metallo-hydrolase [Roseobacter sp. H9]